MKIVVTEKEQENKTWVLPIEGLRVKEVRMLLRINILKRASQKAKEKRMRAHAEAEKPFWVLD